MSDDWQQWHIDRIDQVQATIHDKIELLHSLNNKAFHESVEGDGRSVETVIFWTISEIQGNLQSLDRYKALLGSGVYRVSKGEKIE